MDWIAFVNKWLHLLSIAGIVGGIGIAWLVLVPAAQSEPEGAETLQRIGKRFKTALHGLWGIAILTGVYNLMLVTPSVNKDYQMVLGMKMGLAILMFLASIFLLRTAPTGARFLQEKSGWLLVLLLLGVCLIGLSAHLNLSRINGSGLKQPRTSRLSDRPDWMRADQGQGKEGVGV